MLGEESYGRLIDAIYEASLHPAQWRDVITALLETFDVSYASIYTPFTEKLGLPPIWSTNVDDAFVADYAAHHAQDDIFYAPLLQRIPAESLIWCWDDLASRNEIENWRFYQELCLPRRVRQGIGVMVNTEDYRAAQVTIYSWNTSKAYADEAKKKLRRMEMHLRQALRIHWHVTAASNASSQAQMALDMCRTGIAWLGIDGSLLYANHEFNRLASQRGGFYVHEQHVKMLDKDAQRELLVAIQSGAEGDEYLFSIPRAPGTDALLARVMPLPCNAMALRLRDARAIIFVSEPSCAYEQASKAVAEIYALSPAEGQVLQQVVSGRNAKSISALACLSEHTIRAQIKSIMSKCGVTRQADLILLVAASQVP